LDIHEALQTAGQYIYIGFRALLEGLQKLFGMLADWFQSLPWPNAIKLFSNDTVPYANTVLILLFTGIRLNEFISIKTENVYLKERYFITGSKTDAGKDRIIPISHLIERYISDMYHPDNEFLFSPFNDETIVTKARYRHMFDTVMQQLNMSHTPHECRHTFVSMLDDAGANKVSIQKIAGHKGSDVTEKVYTHKNIEQLLSAIDLLKV